MRAAKTAGFQLVGMPYNPASLRHNKTGAVLCQPDDSLPSTRQSCGARGRTPSRYDWFQILDKQPDKTTQQPGLGV